MAWSCGTASPSARSSATALEGGRMQTTAPGGCAAWDAASFSRWYCSFSRRRSSSARRAVATRRDRTSERRLGSVVTRSEARASGMRSMMASSTIASDSPNMFCSRIPIS
ncbi:uncharacterized protein MONOS_6980 [Monocercomonoides exilis]|uniref:uncharacterized protein n=1 Tax=Monocercomonoides exilis TaxID=2049356 RepID=UPI003559BFCD|nr:hypothetical protein MONOS_6980 [Monocercomonoides exilis]|eukprot:MONOS_6980.1-p1 / transcript=MONOS_6980.1 / gene=MONOS_6980 / organism=Monocercomonoides_exilis_PA203 / gene_product=unspecified product / transcript_product=unspecified product / location=Mono_scaffold00230:32-361(+) / protein_length=110 / sequence_SO=supercontig / SO=protein_coding / is_pseudo=false